MGAAVTQENIAVICVITWSLLFMLMAAGFTIACGVGEIATALKGIHKELKRSRKRIEELDE
jgi:hypothetical protein